MVEKYKKLLVNKKVLIIFLCAIILLVCIGVTYAYFTAIVKGNETAKGAVANTGTMAIELDGTTLVGAESIYPGATITTNFTVENTGTLPVTYAITMIDVYNNFLNKDELVYSITSTNGGGIKTETVAPSTNGKIISPIIIEPGVVQEYTLTIHFKETTGNQNSNQGRTFTGKIQINDISDMTIIEGNVIGYSACDYVQMHSQVQTSQIVDGEYGLIGVEKGTHTIYVMDTMGNIKGQKIVTIVNGKTPSISEDGSTITVSKDNQVVRLNIEVTEDGIDIDGDEIEDELPLLSETIISNSNLISDDPTTTAFAYGEPTTTTGVINGYTYKEVSDVYLTNLTSSNNKTVGRGYIFDSTTGKYTLTDTKKSVSYSDDYIGYYTCDSASFTNCPTIYKIEEVSDSKITKATRYSFEGINSNSGMFSTKDDYGTSYYLRGNITNNYVSFAGLTWKVVRINGDKTIRLVLNGSTGVSSKFNNSYVGHQYVGYTYNNESSCTKSSPCISIFDTNTKTFSNNKNVTNSTIKDYLENNWYINISDYDSYIAQGSFCNDTTIDSIAGDTNYYGANERIVTNNQPSLECNDTAQNFGGYYQSKIGLLSADEVMLAGYGRSGYTNSNNYLYYSGGFWTLSPFNSSNYNANVSHGYNGNLTTGTVNNDFAVRPVINLRSDIKVVSGDGTSSSPYELSL